MSRRSRREDGLVYSTGSGRVCPDCGQFLHQCICRSRDAAPPAGDGIVRVSRQTRGRKGKGVTVITGVPVTAGELLVLARELKAACGSGGTVKDGVIEVQGEHRDKLVAELEKRGYRVKRAGG
jgi:translation initiation factor 1